MNNPIALSKNRSWISIFAVTAAFFLLILLPGFATGEEENKDENEEENKIDEEMQEMVNSHFFRLSIFRIQPLLVAGTGYDSNTLSSPIGQEIEDYYLTVAPGASAAVKLGNRSYFAVEEIVGFIYHQEIEALRHIVSSTSAEFVTGSKNVLFSVRGGFSNPKARVNLEFDVPVQQYRTTGSANLTYGVRPNTDLLFHVDGIRVTYPDDEELDTSLPPPDDTFAFRYGAGVDQRLTDDILLTFDGGVGYYKILNEQDQEKRDFWDLLGGFIFTGDKLVGKARAGYGKSDKSTTQGEFSNFLINTELDYYFGRRSRFGGSINRSRSISNLIPDSFVVTTEGGLRATLPLSDILAITMRGTVGSNNYGDNFFLDLGPITKDDYYLVGSSLEIDLPSKFKMSVGVNYINRDSNQPTLTKKRLVLVAAFGLEGG